MFDPFLDELQGTIQAAGGEELALPAEFKECHSSSGKSNLKNWVVGRAGLRAGVRAGGAVLGGKAAGLGNGRRGLPLQPRIGLQAAPLRGGRPAAGPVVSIPAPP